MNSHKVGLTLGFFAGLWHLVWSVLIALGWAGSLLDFVFSMHSLNNPYIIAPFSLGRSVLLVVITFVIGYVVGNVFVKIWKSVHK